MNKRIRKKKRKQALEQKIDFQTAWNVVVENLKNVGEHTFFIESGTLTDDGEWDIHTVSPNRTIIKSNLKNR